MTDTVCVFEDSFDDGKRGDGDQVSADVVSHLASDVGNAENGEAGSDVQVSGVEAVSTSTTEGDSVSPTQNPLDSQQTSTVVGKQVCFFETRGLSGKYSLSFMLLLTLSHEQRKYSN